MQEGLSGMMSALQADEAAAALCVLASSFTAVVPRPCARGDNEKVPAAPAVRFLRLLFSQRFCSTIRVPSESGMNHTFSTLNFHACPVIEDKRTTLCSSFKACTSSLCVRYVMSRSGRPLWRLSREESIL